MGGSSGWVEWLRVHVNPQLMLDESCVVATPLAPASALENWRPILEYGDGGFEWAVHTKAWCAAHAGSSPGGSRPLRASAGASATDRPPPPTSLPDPPSPPL